MQKLPKVELHVHVERALRFQTVQRLDPNFTPRRYVRELLGLPSMPHYDAYVARRCAALAHLQSEEALRLALKDLAQQLRDDGVIYAELRFAPFLHTRQGLSPENMVRVVVNALDRACRETRVTVHVILCTTYTASENQSNAVVQLVERFQGTRVVGFGLMEDPCHPARHSDALWSAQTHLPAFTAALQMGLPRVVDADETVGVERLWEMAALYVPRRVGHGWACAQDFDLQALFRARRTHLELCPTRDVQLGLCADWRAHPLEALYRKGLALSVNTDGRVTTPTTLSDTYQALQTHCGWRKEELLVCNLMALEAAFASPTLKARLRARLHRAYSAP